MRTSGVTIVPKVVGMPFGRAVRRLLDHDLLISVRHFAPFHHAMAEQGWGRLENYRVLSQSRAPRSQVKAGAAMVLTLSTPVFSGPLGSMVEPSHHPRYARVPDLVGRDYRRAFAAGRAFTTGIFVRVGQTGPLLPSASSCGLDAFVVVSQRPRPGRLVRWGGVEPDGVQPSLATVTIRLAARPPASHG